MCYSIVLFYYFDSGLSRLCYQKGVDLIMECLDWLMQDGGGFDVMCVYVYVYIHTHIYMYMYMYMYMYVYIYIYIYAIHIYIYTHV